MPLRFWTYILRCSDGSFYIGHTDLLEARIGQHQRGLAAAHTKHRRPITLVWCQEFPTRLEALEAEWRVKGWRRAKKEALIAGDWGLLSSLSRAYGSLDESAGHPSTGSPSTGSGQAARTEERDRAFPTGADRGGA